MRLVAPSFVVASAWALLALVACSESKPDSESTTGGSTGAGTNAGGGVANTGGTAVTGGAAPTGGVANTGGTAVTGGATPTGGTATMMTTGGSSGEVYPPTFTTVKAILASNEGMCSAAPCHSSLGRLSLTDNANLLMRMTSFMSEACGMPFITPGKPEMSAFVKILKGPCGETPQMPYGCIPGMFGTCLPDDYVAVIERWITNGARND